MKYRNLLPAFTMLTVLCVSSSAGWAKHNAGAKKSVTETGCLQKGDEANEYKITGADGKTYGLFAKGTVDLAKHVGHKVEVTGTEKKMKSTGSTSTANS